MKSRILFTFCHILVVYTALQCGSANEQPRSQDSDTIAEELTTIRSEMNSLRHQLSEESHFRAQLKSQLSQQQITISHQRETISMLTQAVGKQQHRVQEQEKEMKLQKDEMETYALLAREREKSIGCLRKSIEAHEFNVNTRLKSMEKATEMNDFIHMQEEAETFTRVGCLSETLTLSCPSERAIEVTSAVYGKYVSACIEPCCLPNPSQDCTEQVSENRPSDWAALKLLCDGSTMCAYEYLGSVIPQCEENYIADYMQIYYNCLPEAASNVSDVVAFTAYATETRNYTLGQAIVWNNVEVNLGQHFDGSTFTCPFSGVYFFSASFNAETGASMSIEIVMGTYEVAEALADDVGTARNHASCFVIVECTEGQVVYTRSGWSNTGTLFGNAKKAQFAGYLLDRY